MGYNLWGGMNLGMNIENYLKVKIQPRFLNSFFHFSCPQATGKNDYELKLSALKLLLSEKKQTGSKILRERDSKAPKLYQSKSD